MQEVLPWKILPWILCNLILFHNLFCWNQSGILHLSMWQLVQKKAVHQIPHQLPPTVRYLSSGNVYICNDYVMVICITAEQLWAWHYFCRSRRNLAYRIAHRSLLACDTYCCLENEVLSGENCKYVSLPMIQRVNITHALNNTIK